MRLIRLNGKEWYSLKEKLIYVKTIEVNDSGHIKCMLTDGEKLYGRWLDDEEIKLWKKANAEHKVFVSKERKRLTSSDLKLIKENKKLFE